MSEPISDKGNNLEAALQALAPLPASLNRDRLMFQAGRASRKAKIGFQPMVTGALAVTVAVLGWLLWIRPRPEERVRTIYVRVPVKVPVPAPAPQSMPRTDPFPENPPEKEIPQNLTQDFDQLPEPSYIRMKQQVQRSGVDALPPPSQPGPPANEPPMTVNRLLGLPATSSENFSWAIP